jgi:nitrate reductase NapAB chaperone NapD
VFLSSMSGSIATQVWQVAAKENQLEKVQDELQQVRGCWVVFVETQGKRQLVVCARDKDQGGAWSRQLPSVKSPRG